MPLAARRAASPGWPLGVAVVAVSAIAAELVFAEASASAPEEAPVDEAFCDVPDDRIQATVQTRINLASALAALSDGSMSQIPISGAVFTRMIQMAMIYGIGLAHGCHLDRSKLLMVLTFLSSEHAKKAVLGHLVGYIPLAGNVVKGSVTLLITQGIGQVADRMLRCPPGQRNLLSQAAQAAAEAQEQGAGGAEAGAGGGTTQYFGEMSSSLFNLVTDYIVSPDFAAIGADEVLLRARDLFSPRNQEQLLAQLHAAESADEIASILRQHRWNLGLVEAALRLLEERYPATEACIAGGFVAERLWTPVSADMEARRISAPYLSRCSAFLPAEILDGAAEASVELVVGPDALHGGLSAPVLRTAFALIGQGYGSSPAAEPPAGDVGGSSASPAGPASRHVPALLSAALEATALGEASACEACRSLLAAERRARPGTSSPWIAVWHLRALNGLSVPDGAATCVEQLRAEVASDFWIAAPPRSVELPPSPSSGAAAPLSPRLEEALSDAVVGQRCAVQRLAQHPGHARLRQRGMWRKDMPLVLLLTGPSGTGKTLIARRLAEAILQRPISVLEVSGRFRTFHMNLFTLLEDQKSFFGPPKGIQGVGDLPELLRQWPDAVVLLDEIEKAHPSFARALLKVFGEHGAVYDPRTGRDIPTANATFVLTSNLAKDFIASHPAARAKEAASDPDCTVYAQLREDVSTALRSPFVGGTENFFKESEVRGRLTDILPFLPFSAPEVEAAVRRFLAQEAAMLAKAPEFHNVALAWEPEVVALFAQEYARRPDEGLRGVHVQLDTAVRELLESSIDAGLLRQGCGVVLRVVAVAGVQRVDLRIVPPTRRQPASAGKQQQQQQQQQQDSSSGAERPTVISAFAGGSPHAGGATLGSESVFGGLLSSFFGSDDSSETGDGEGGAFGLQESVWPPPLENQGWLHMTQWQREQLYEWEVWWDWLREILWEWRLALALVAATLFVSAAVSWLPTVARSGTAGMCTLSQASMSFAATGAGAPVGIGTAASATGSAAAAAGIGVAAPSVFSFVGNLLGFVRLAASAGTAAVPLVTAAYAWHIRQDLWAAASAAVGLLAALFIARLMSRCCAARQAQSTARQCQDHAAYAAHAAHAAHAAAVAATAAAAAVGGDCSKGGASRRHSWPEGSATTQLFGDLLQKSDCTASSACLES